jgi:hypothetical protein
MCLHFLISYNAEGMALKPGIGEGGLHEKVLRESNINFNLCELQIELQQFSENWLIASKIYIYRINYTHH